MRPYGRIIPIGVILTATLLFVAIRAKSQAPAAQAWQYLSVTGSLSNPATITGAFSRSYPSSATICFVTTEGCQSEQVTLSFNERSPGGEALASAIAQVGEQGWELTTSSEIENARVLYFKRLKSDAK